MNILIAGDGKVGAALVRQLSGEGYNITLIDSNHDKLTNTMNRYDVMAVHGNCASLGVLNEAKVQEADLLIAATSADEVNLLCCLTAHAVNPRLHTIARIRNPEYTDQIYKMREAFALSLSVNPELQAAREILRLLQYPGFLRRDTFAKGRVEIVELKVRPGSRLCNLSLIDLYKVVKCRVLICAVVRDGVAIAPSGDFTLREGDRIYVTAPSQNLHTLLKNLEIVSRPVKRVLIAGGDRVSVYLTELLIKSGMEVKIIERDLETCKQLAEQLPEAIIVQGDASSQAVLENENIQTCDAVVSLTGLDELNMMISMIASSLKVPQVITKLGHMESTPLLNDLPLGSIVYPKELCSNTIVRYVRALQNQTGAAVAVHTIADGQVEASEFIVDETTLHVGKPLKELKLRNNVLVVCITHGSATVIPDGNSCFNIGDTVIVVSGNKQVLYSLNDIFA